MDKAAIREEHPSQQGLRHLSPERRIPFQQVIREEHPSQQGLRLLFPHPIYGK